MRIVSVPEKARCGLMVSLDSAASSSQNPDIATVQAYWDRRPCNIRHSNALVGTREYFDQVEARKYFVEPHIPDFAQFQRWAGKRVLEIGCGIGTDAVNFARAGADYTAIELSEASLALARQRVSTFGRTGSCYHANAEQLRSVVGRPGCAL